MMIFFMIYAAILSFAMYGALLLIKKYSRGSHIGVWYITTSFLYLCFIFLGAAYLFRIPV